MNIEERNEKIDEVFTEVMTALKTRLKHEDCTDKDILAGLKFLSQYEMERLPVAGAATSESGDHPFPIAKTA